MNRIYKVVWSKAKNCYTVVSEIAKRHGKGNRTRTCAAAFLAAFALTGVMGMSEVQAADVTADNVNANWIQTNALNSKYNLSVGTANSNGIMPFFVNSTGAFYAANNKFSVDKDGKVIATAGEIGNVVLQNGVYTGHSKLLDGELLVGDASGSYSQITPKSAKLGQVTIDEKGNIASVNSIQTNALNAKYNLSVGTANPNGIMPFFVNSSGAFYAANNKFSVDKDGKVTATAGEIGNVVLQNGVYTGHSKLLDGELLVGDASGSYSQITPNSAKLGQVTIDEKGKISGVAAGTADTDAVNVGQLNKTVADAVKDAAKASDVGNISDIHKDLQNKEGSTTVVGAVNNLDNKVGDLNYSAVTEGDIKDGDSSTTAIGKLNKKLSGVAAVAGQHSSVSTTDENIKIQERPNAAGGKDYQLSLNPDQKLHSVTTGETKMDTKGLSIGDKTYVSKDGLNANNQTITNVKDGKIEEGSKDAVNGGQLYATNQLVKENASNISLLGNSINKLDNRVDKVGAGAAALAALHPLDFDPEDKWDFAAGYGNYSGASAVALGAYYRPNEDTMFSVGGSFGNGENMVNAGVSLKLGQSNHAPASKAAMEKKISALSQEVEELKAAIADLRAAQTKAKDATEKDAQKK